MAESKYSFLFSTSSETSQKLQQIAREKLGESEELKKECLQQLRILIEEHKVTCISADDFLLRFLRIKKFNVQRSFDVFRHYAHQRIELFKHLLKLQPEIIEECLRLNIVGLLPYRDAEERIVIFFRPGFWKKEICSVHEYFTVCFLLANLISEKESSQISGLGFIANLESLPFSYILQLILVLKRSKRFLFNCVPLRYTSLHVISNSVLFQYFFSVVSPFIPKKLAERVVLHDDEEAFFEHTSIPRSSLPDILGGAMGPLDSEQVIEEMVAYHQKLKDEYRYLQNDI